MYTSELAPDDARVRDIVAAYLDGADLSVPPAAEDLQNFEFAQTVSMAGQTYKLDRDTTDVARAFDVSSTTLKRFAAGKRILDIGCGTGSFVHSLAKDKSVSAVGIDLADNFMQSPLVGRNLEFRQASGYEAESMYEPEFDVVMSIYSHLYWAKNPAESQRAVSSTLAVTKPGGTALFVPVVKDIELTRDFLERADEYDPSAIRALEARHYVMATGLQELLTREADGEVACAFRASSRNKQGVHESYSVAARLLEKETA